MRHTINFRDNAAQCEFIAPGHRLTPVLTVVTIFAGLAIGAAGAAARVHGRVWLAAAVGAYVEVIRNTPLIVQLFIVFFGLPGFGVRLEPMPAAIVGLVVDLGAFATETIRAGLEAVPRTHVEAGYGLGLSGRLRQLRPRASAG